MNSAPRTPSQRCCDMQSCPTRGMSPCSRDAVRTLCLLAPRGFLAYAFLLSQSTTELSDQQGTTLHLLIGHVEGMPISAVTTGPVTSSWSRQAPIRNPRRNTNRLPFSYYVCNQQYPTSFGQESRMQGQFGNSDPSDGGLPSLHLDPMMTA